MTRSKPFLTLIIRAISLLMVLSVSCVKPAIMAKSGGGLDEKLAELNKISGLVVYGDISVKSKDVNMEGDFRMSINRENMGMDIYSKGIKAGEIIIEAGEVRTHPRIGNEYLEYMFAVIMRDSVTWWNIHGYDFVDNGILYVIRNSWKKIYMDPSVLIPKKQVIRLTKYREIEISYSDVKDYGFHPFPSRIEFQFRSYECTLLIKRLEIGKMLRG